MPKSLTAVLIEDQQSDAALFQKKLEKAVEGTLRLTHATTLADGLSLVKTHMPECVFLDLNLPDSLGVKTVQRFQESFPDMPVIILTGNDQIDEGVLALRLGAHDYLSKDHLDIRALQYSIRFTLERAKVKEFVQQQQELMLSYSYGIAHDVKSPLARISQLTTLLLAEQQTGTSKEYLKLMQEIVQNSMDYISDLLNRKQVEINFPDLINKIKEELNVRNDLEKVQLETGFHHTDYLFHFEEGTLQTILYNLIGNAINYKDDQKETSFVKVYTYDHKQGICLSVEDNGTGMTPAQMKNIAKPKKKNPDSKLSTGMGLYILHQLIYSHNGGIEVSSEKDQGTTFVVYLPTQLSQAK